MSSIAALSRAVVYLASNRESDLIPLTVLFIVIYLLILEFRHALRRAIALFVLAMKLTVIYLIMVELLILSIT